MSRRPRSVWRGRLYSVAKAAVSLGLLAWLLHKAGLQSLGSTISHASWKWLVVGFCFGLLATSVQAGQWQALLRALEMPRSWARCLRLVFVGNTFNTVLPTSIGGDVVRAAMVAEQPSERVRAFTTVVLQRLCNFPGMIVILCLGLLLTLGYPQADRIRPVALLGAVVGITALAVCATPLLGWLARRPLLQRIKIGKLFQQLHEFRRQRRQLLLASLRGTVFWSLSVLNWWSFMHAVGIDVALPFAAVVTTTVSAITMLPVSINGYGVREGSFTAFLTAAGLATTSAAVTASLILAAQSLLWGLIGLPFLLAASRSRKAVSVSALELTPTHMAR